MDLGVRMGRGALRLIETVINVSPRLSKCNGGENGGGGVIKKLQTRLLTVYPQRLHLHVCSVHLRHKDRCGNKNRVLFCFLPALLYRSYQEFNRFTKPSPESNVTRQILLFYLNCSDLEVEHIDTYCMSL